MKRVKKFLAVLLTVVLLPVSAAFAQEGDVTAEVYLNGAKVESDVPAILRGGRTMLPFRALFNAFGVDDSDIKWDGTTQSIEITGEGRYIYIAVGVMGIVTNHGYIALDVPPFVENDRTYVPVRAISDIFGAQITWDEATTTVKVTSAA